jgi:hypothetical protein
VLVSQHRSRVLESLTNNNNQNAYAGHLNSFKHLRALLVLHDRGSTIIVITNHAYAGQLNGFTRPRTLLVLHDRRTTIIIITRAYARQLNRVTHLRALLIIHDSGICYRYC